MRILLGEPFIHSDQKPGMLCQYCQRTLQLCFCRAVAMSLCLSLRLFVCISVSRSLSLPLSPSLSLSLSSARSRSLSLSRHTRSCAARVALLEPRHRIASSAFAAHVGKSWLLPTGTSCSPSLKTLYPLASQSLQVRPSPGPSPSQKVGPGRLAQEVLSLRLVASTEDIRPSNTNECVYLYIPLYTYNVYIYIHIFIYVCIYTCLRASGSGR